MQTSESTFYCKDAASVKIDMSSKRGLPDLPRVRTAYYGPFQLLVNLKTKTKSQLETQSESRSVGSLKAREREIRKG